MSQVLTKDTCGQNSGYSDEDKTSQDRMLDLCRRLKKNDLGRVLIEFAILADVNIYLTNEIETAGFYQRTVFDDHEIYLNADCDDYTLFVALAHELRHLAQNITLDCTLHDFSLEDAIVLNRFLEADASAYSNAVALIEYQETGDEKFIKASAVYSEQDIMKAIKDTFVSGKPISKNKDALRAGFNAWFTKKKRVKHYDKAVKAQQKEFKDSVASLFYIKDAKRLSNVFVSKVGAVVPRVNYLRGKGAPNLMSDKYRPSSA